MLKITSLPPMDRKGATATMTSTSNAAVQRHLSQGTSADTRKKIHEASESISQNQSKVKGPISGVMQTASASQSESEFTKRLDLLERRFFAPPLHVRRKGAKSVDATIDSNMNGSRPTDYVTHSGARAHGDTSPLGSTDDIAEVIYHHQNSGSHHSFTFDPESAGTGTPSKQKTSTHNSKKRRLANSSPSTQLLENVVDQHTKKVSRTLAAMPQDSTGMNSYSRGASAPYNPSFADVRSPASASNAHSNTNRSHSMSSNQTLITAHVTKRNASAHEVIVAESPPIINDDLNKPGTFARNGATPRVARTILAEATTSKKTVTPSKSCNKRKSSVPVKLPEKKRQRNLRFHDDQKSEKVERPLSLKTANTSPPVRVGCAISSGIAKTMPITPVMSSAVAPSVSMETLTSLPRISSNSARLGFKTSHAVGSGVSSSITSTAAASGTTAAASGNQKPPESMLITNFFASSQSSKKKAAKPSSQPSKQQKAALKITGKNKNSNGQPNILAMDIPADTHLLKEIAHLKSTIASLNESLDEKSSQLKAVSNNQTIIHSQLKKTLQDREEEIKSLKSDMTRKSLRSCDALEAFVRKDSARELEELRQKIASDGTRLGRWVSNWVGMRREMAWEDGSALIACAKKRAELKRKRIILETRLKEESESLRDIDAMEKEEFQQSINVHLEQLEFENRKLDQEENVLNAEKNAHKLALKKMANEDYSKFKSRPKLNDRYVLMAQLGKGGFSEVWRAYDLVEVREVAVKIHQLDPRWSEAKIENYTKHVAREYEIHRDVRHPRIVSLYDVFEIDDNTFATVLECCKGTDLDTLLKERKRLPENHARAILLQILSGMRYLCTPSEKDKRQGIIHYDLKPGNILFDEFGDAKITDFGLSKIMDSPDPSDSMELTSQGAGTYWYLPPECFVTTESVRITNKVDVWSIGVIYYQMLYGRRPFGDGQSQEGVLHNNVMLNAREVRFPDSPTVSEEAKAFVRYCLTYEQRLRPSISELCKSSYVRGDSE